MKKLSLLFLIGFISFTVSAQDLGVENIVVRAQVDTGWQQITNDTVLLNETIYLGVVLKNHGSSFVDANDSVAFAVSVNGILFGTYGAKVGKGLAPAAGFNTTEVIIKKDQVFTTPISNAKVCAWPVFWSKSNLGGQTSNDTSCATYNILDRVVIIKSFSPAEGKAGTDITITGSNFGALTASNVVKFNGEPAVIKSFSPYTIVATVPGAALSGKISIEASGKTGTSTEGFTILDADGNPKNALSIADVNEISSFIGYSNNELTISTSDVSSDMKIFDLTGKVVSTVSNIPSNTVHTVNLSGLHSGVYIATFGSEYLKFSK